MSLKIIQAKPNPAGKEHRKENSKDQDGYESTALEAQKFASVYLGEWVDVKNVGEDAVNFQTMQLRHALFDNECHTIGEMELIWIGDIRESLKPGQVLRVHGGRRETAHLMAQEDHDGADWHGYAEKDNFILNNRCGDKIVVSWHDDAERIQSDWVCYPPHPPENLILQRSGNLLTGPGPNVELIN